MQEIGWRQVLILRKASLEQTELSKTTLNITTFVSIGIVSLICIIIYPLLIKALDRIYITLQFFNNLDKDMFSKCLEKGYIYRRQLRTKFGNKQKRDIDENDSIIMAQDEIEQHEDEKSDNHSSSKTVSPMSKRAESKSSRRAKETDSKRVFFSNSNNNLEQIKRKNINKKTSSKTNDKKQNDGLKYPYAQAYKKHQNKKDSDYDQFHKNKKLDKIQEEEKEQNESIEHSESEESEKNQKKLSKRQRRMNQDARDILKLEVTSSTTRYKLFNLQINRIALTQKIKIFGLIILLIGFLNCSLVISFTQSQIVFENDKESIIQLQKVYFREECVYNLILFLREKLIRNYTLVYNLYDTPDTFQTLPAVYNYVERCFENENEIGQLRKNLPLFLVDAKDKFDMIEDSRICNMTYGYYDYNKARDCELSLDGLLSKGQGNSLYYLISLVQQINLNFDGYQQIKQQAFVNTLLNSKKLHDFTDFAFLYLKDSLDLIQQTLSDSAITYFNKARSNYLLAFSLFMCFTVLLTVILGTILYMKVKTKMLHMQNMLCIIPFDELPPNQRQKLEAYLNK